MAARTAQRCHRPGRLAHGVTLIELMVAVAIVAILAAIAYPSYEAQLRKSRRAEAMELLLDVASRQEQFMLNHSTYTATLGATGLGYGASRIADGKLQSENGYYALTVALATCNADARITCAACH
jgi:type IV pilus assembly protein PilE